MDTGGGSANCRRVLGPGVDKVRLAHSADSRFRGSPPAAVSSEAPVPRDRATLPPSDSARGTGWLVGKGPQRNPGDPPQVAFWCPGVRYVPIEVDIGKAATCPHQTRASRSRLL